MPISATTLSMLMAAGLDGQALIDVVASIDADMGMPERAAPKSAGAARQKRYRNRKASQSVTCDVTSDVTGDGSSPPSPLDKENPPAPPKEINPPLPPDTPAPRAGMAVLSELMVVLDESRARAVVDHRKTIRKPLTVHAAKLLASKLGLMPDPNLAADIMIGNGWQGFEADWLQRRAGACPRASPRHKKTEHQLRQEAVLAALDKQIHGDDDDHEPADKHANIDLGPGDYRSNRNAEAWRQ